MDAKQKAKELVDHYYDVVYPYIGSDYMTGTESPSLKFRSAKKEAEFFINGMMECSEVPDGLNKVDVGIYRINREEEWMGVKRELLLINEEEYLKSKI